MTAIYEQSYKEFDDIQYNNFYTIFYSKLFIINDSTRTLIEKKYVIYTNVESIINDIESYERETGIMIGGINIDENNFIFILVFDKQIILVDQNHIHKFKPFLDEITNKTEIYYLNSKCMEKIQEIQLNNIDNLNIQITQPNLSDKIQKQIAYCIIKKSQIRTQNRRFESKKNDNLINFDYNDFIEISYFCPSTKLSFNIQDQFLYTLKYYKKTDQYSYKQFYRITKFFIDNKDYINPFISKFYGQTEDKENMISVFEYVEGVTLKKFINNEKGKINEEEKMRIIISLMCALEYLHLNNHIYRDLKSDNIIIDSKRNPILIDFDYLKMNDNNEMTADIGSDVYASQFQKSSNYYSYETDINSLGKIIHFIINENEDEINIKSFIPKCPKGYESFLDIYKYCFETKIDKVPTISFLLNETFMDILYKENNIDKPILQLILDNREILYNSLIKSHLIDEELKYIHYFFIDLYSYGNYINIKKAIYFLECHANQNDSFSQYRLGDFYYNGYYDQQDINKAIYYYENSAKLNCNLAQNQLGYIYYYGDYVMKNKKKALYYFSLAAKNEDSTAQFFIGLLYYEGKDVSFDIKKALYYFTLSANQNDSNAQFYIGLLYYEGIHVSHDIKMAIHYFVLSANQNNSYAQFYIGLLYYEGIYVSHDIKMAIHYFVLSANQNNSYAQFYIGLYYSEGKFVKRDIKKAIYYLSLSAKKDKNALYALGLIYLSNLDDNYHNIEKSIYYLKLSSKNNHLDATFMLGKIYYDNKLVPCDIKKSIYYFSHSINHSNSKYYLGIIYFEGKFVPKNMQKAIELFTLSAKQNNQYAQLELGRIYNSSKYGFKNIKKAIYYLKLSAEQNNLNAQFILGTIYYEGKHVQRDIKLVIKYFKECSCFNMSFAKNNLGVIYKNGDGVKKNIENAIIYFEEAIKISNDSYSILNLARIYYFGIDVNPDIEKSIELLLKLSNKFVFAELFLYCIYHYGDRSIKNNKNIVKWRNEQKEFYHTTNERYDLFIIFFYEYDFVYTKKNDLDGDFLYYMITGTIKSAIKNTYNMKLSQNIHQKNVIDDNHFNTDFYDGFDIKF